MGPLSCGGRAPGPATPAPDPVPRPEPGCCPCPVCGVLLPATARESLVLGTLPRSWPPSCPSSAAPETLLCLLLLPRGMVAVSPGRGAPPGLDRRQGLWLGPRAPALPHHLHTRSRPVRSCGGSSEGRCCGRPRPLPGTEKGRDSRPAKLVPTWGPEPSLEAAAWGPARGPGLAVLVSPVWPDHRALSTGQAQEEGAARTPTHSCLGACPPGTTATTLPHALGRPGQGRGPAIAGWRGGRLKPRRGRHLTWDV